MPHQTVKSRYMCYSKHNYPYSKIGQTSRIGKLYIEDAAAYAKRTDPHIVLNLVSFFLIV